MTVGDLQDPGVYVYIKVLSKLAGRFKEGDYIEVSTLDYNDAGDTMKWSKSAHYIDSFRSKLDSDKNFNITFIPVYKITKSEDGYIEAEGVNPQIGTIHEYKCSIRKEDLTGDSLRELIEDYVCELNYDTKISDAIEFFVNNYIKLDEDYADSIIFESPFVPYRNAESVTDMLKKITEAKELEQKELFRRRAVIGHVTRKENKIAARKQEAENKEIDNEFKAMLKALKLKDLSKSKKKK